MRNMVTSVDAETYLKKRPTTPMIKTSNKLGMKGNFFNVIKNKTTITKTMTNTEFNGEKPKSSPN